MATSFVRIFTLIMIIALAMIVAPTLLEIIAFCFVLFLQVVVTLYIFGVIYGVITRVFAQADDAEQTWQY